MNNDKTQAELDEEEAMNDFKQAAAHGAAVALVGFALWIGGMVVAGKINDAIFGRE